MEARGFASSEKSSSGNSARAGSKPTFFSATSISDHIQGIYTLFSSPLQSIKSHFNFYFALRGEVTPCSRSTCGNDGQSLFPVDISRLPSSRTYIDLVEGTFAVADTEITVLPLNRPQGCIGCRAVVQNGKVLCFCTGVGTRAEWSDRNIRILAKDADVLIMDSQYTPEELSEHVGWGHSTWKQSLETGIECGAKKLSCFEYMTLS